MPAGHLVTFACVTCAAIHTSPGTFMVADVDKPRCNDIGLWEAFRAIHGPRPGGRGSQARWEKQWEQFQREHCDHEWTEGVDEDGNLIEPAFDVCTKCGKEQH